MGDGWHYEIHGTPTDADEIAPLLTISRYHVLRDHPTRRDVFERMPTTFATMELAEEAARRWHDDRD